MMNDRRWSRLARLGLAVVVLLTCSGETVHADEITDQVLMVVAQTGQVDAVTRLIAEGANLETTDEHGRTPLHLAAASGKTDIVKALLAAGARVDVADQDGNEPLHIAVVSPTNGQIVKALLNAGARVDTATHDGMQPIHLAARSAGAGTVQTLLASGAKSDAVDAYGLRPLHLVAQGGVERINASRGAHNLSKLLYGMEYTMVVKVLLSNGASLDLEDKTGKRPIDYASEGGFSEMVDLLLAAGAKPPR